MLPPLSQSCDMVHPFSTCDPCLDVQSGGVRNAACTFWPGPPTRLSWICVLEGQQNSQDGLILKGPGYQVGHTVHRNKQTGRERFHSKQLHPTTTSVSVRQTAWFPRTAERRRAGSPLPHAIPDLCLLPRLVAVCQLPVPIVSFTLGRY